MDIAYIDEPIRRLCTSDRAAKNKFGDLFAQELQARIADIRAADSVDDLIVGLRVEVGGDRGEIRTIDLTGGASIVFVANHRNNPMTADGSIDWSIVDRVKIVHVGEGIV